MLILALFTGYLVLCLRGVNDRFKSLLLVVTISTHGEMTRSSLRELVVKSPEVQRRTNKFPGEPRGREGRGER